MLCNYFQNSHRKKGSFPFSFGECLRHWLQRVVNKETLKQALIGIKRQLYVCTACKGTSLCSSNEKRPFKEWYETEDATQSFYILISLTRMREVWWRWLMCTVGLTGPEEWRFVFCQSLSIFLPRQENRSTYHKWCINISVFCLVLSLPSLLHVMPTLWSLFYFLEAQLEGAAWESYKGVFF